MHRPPLLSWLIAMAGLSLVGSSVFADPAARIVDVRKIWDAAPHNAFTDLIRFQDRWWCAFREGDGHVSANGTIRVLTSVDGQAWESAASLSHPRGDLRDPKLCLGPQGQLMLTTALCSPTDTRAHHQSVVWLSRDARDWGEPTDVCDLDFWLWRVIWKGDTGYGIAYQTGKNAERSIRLYTTQDGRHFETFVANLFDQGYPNETGLAFEPDGTLLCLLRRDGQQNSAQLGQASAPYSQWSWRDLGVRIGGPQLIRLPDGRYVAAGRLYDGRVRTSLLWLDPQAATLTEFLPLPSGGDSSYPGLVWHDDRLWVSYYSSHEGKTSIYLARVELPPP
jgi:hypothetical protein